MARQRLIQWVAFAIGISCLGISQASCTLMERYLTAEQDAEFREKCAETGCVIIPIPLWMRILQALQGPGQKV